MFLRHIPFIRAVILYAITAFGGPQGHLGMMIKTFVQKRRDVTEEELAEYNAFCQMLPGPSSTQTVVLIALKRGGIPLAVITLLCWVLPAAVIMGAFSFLLLYINAKELQSNLFLYVQPMSVGFIVYAAVRMAKTTIKHFATWMIMLGALLATYLIRSPWVFPVILIVAGIISNFSNKRIPETKSKPKPIKWVNLWLFILLFILAGIFSGIAKAQDWEYGRLMILFENFYRFGTIVFGGGQVLVPMMLYQFVNRPIQLGQEPLLSSVELL